MCILCAFANVCVTVLSVTHVERRVCRVVVGQQDGSARSAAAGRWSAPPATHPPCHVAGRHPTQHHAEPGDGAHPTVRPRHGHAAPPGGHVHQPAGNARVRTAAGAVRGSGGWWASVVLLCVFGLFE